MVTLFVCDHPRLEPRTEWTGGRIAEMDMISLDEAAQMASEHAGQAITVNDFLRAGGRGEIRIHADCPRTVTLHPCRATDKTIEMPKGHFARLPLDACRVLAIRGVAEWRTKEEFETGEPGTWFEGELVRFVRWQLADGEESLSTTLKECLVMGREVHAFADAFLDSTDHADDDAAKPVQAPEPEVRQPLEDHSALATRTQLIAAFGVFTGMSMTWFDNLKDTPALLKARKVDGVGARGKTRQPLFCPFEVMLWLIDPKRKKGRRFHSAGKPWELLEHHFAAVYVKHSMGDPR